MHKKMNDTRPDARLIVAMFRVLVAIPAMCYGAVISLGTLWFGFQHGVLDAFLRIVAIPTFAILPFIPFTILPRRVVTIAIPVLCTVAGAHALRSLPSDFGRNERILWGLWATVPMVTLIADAVLTGLQKKRIEPKVRQVSSEAAPSASPAEPST